jgi:LysR family transcriptional regulator, nod-box dependent transcriptional activator
MTEDLLVEPFVCIARDDEGSSDTIDYADRPHATFALEVDFAASLEQTSLDERGEAQFNRVMSSNFTILPLIVATSNCVALVPRGVARLAARSLPLRILSPPIPVPDLEMVAIWSRRRTTDPALLWLRRLMRRAAEHTR